MSGPIIKSDINNGFKMGSKSLNEFLATKPFNVPTHFMGVFELQAMDWYFYNNYVYVGMTPVFVAPN